MPNLILRRPGAVPRDSTEPTFGLGPERRADGRRDRNVASALQWSRACGVGACQLAPWRLGATRVGRPLGPSSRAGHPGALTAGGSWVQSVAFVSLRNMGFVGVAVGPAVMWALLARRLTDLPPDPFHSTILTPRSGTLWYSSPALTGSVAALSCGKPRGSQFLVVPRTCRVGVAGRRSRGDAAGAASSSRP